MKADDFVNPHTLGLSKGRFWSSGNQLPAGRVIARVLLDPTEDDLEILKDRFGMELVLSTWEQLEERNEVPECVLSIVEAMLQKLYR